MSQKIYLRDGGHGFVRECPEKDKLSADVNQDEEVFVAWPRLGEFFKIEDNVVQWELRVDGSNRVKTVFPDVVALARKQLL